MEEKIKLNEYERLSDETKNKLIKKQENNIEDFIKHPVRIQNKKIVIPFNSEKDLERILEILNVEVKVD